MKKKELAIIFILLFFGATILSINAELTLDDNTPPITTHEFIGTMGDNDWYISDVTITLEATDNESGVNITYYCLDKGEYEIYEEPIIVWYDGEHIIEYYSIDVVGNVEATNLANFKLDQTSPTIFLYWDNKNKLLIADVYDQTSGVGRVEFFINEELVGEVTEPPWQWRYPNETRGDIAKAIAYDVAGNCLEVPLTGPPPFFGIVGIIFNRKFEEENVSFFAIITRTRYPHEWNIFKEITMPNNYTGHIGLFFINAEWRYFK